MNFQTWLNSVLGQKVDVDGVYGDQCVDIAESYCKFLFPNVNWPQTLGVGNAKDLFDKANTTYFFKTPYRPGLAPNVGDMVIFGPTSTNPFGHIAVVTGITASGMNVVEQNGFNPNGVAYQATRPYINVIGYLQPKVKIGVDMATNDIDQLYKILDQTNKNLDNLYNIVNEAMKSYEAQISKLYILLDESNKRIDKLEAK